MNQKLKDVEPLVATVDQAAKLLQISRGHCFQMVREGRIPSIRFGKRILISRKVLDDLLSGDWKPSVESND